MTTFPVHPKPVIDYKSVLAAHQASVPRYTSYPTAPQFQTGTGRKVMKEMLGKLPPDEGVSVYIHIPFCDRLCWFCGCHTRHTLKYAPISRYLESLHQEIEILSEHLPFMPRLKSLHLGGGSPSLLKQQDMADLRAALATTFQFGPDTEISIEIDPSDANSELYDALLALGVTRTSIGVQDFHPEVQAAINRPQSFEQTRRVVQGLRGIGIRSINVDALYGLPLQSTDRLRDTLAKCVDMEADRMALFGYAHIPWFKKHQRLINEWDLPDNIMRFEQADMASGFLQGAGYHAIGIDHFAKPDDALSVAAKNGRLHRNFQGYTTDNCQTLFGLGASSIGRFDGAYVQNQVATGQYQQCVAGGQLPAEKGLKLSMDDRIRAHIIERLMCDFRICLTDLEHRFTGQADSKCFETYRREAINLAAHDPFGLCRFSDDTLTIPTEARAFTRIVASNFDAYYQRETAQFSKAV
jgi:oxygen-independent coproporphyrinogen-3 oxidase